MRRLEREYQRLVQVRASLERLCAELREDLSDSERRNRCAEAEVRLLRRDAERREREYADARRQIRQLERLAERRDQGFAAYRERLRLLERQSSNLAAAFLAVTASKSWRLGRVLLWFPRRIVRRQSDVAVDELRSLASDLAGRSP